MNKDDLFPSKYLKHSDLRGRDVSVTIDRVEKVSMPDGKKKGAIFFRNTEKGLILNATNYTTIAQNVGTEDTDDWSGQKIVLYPSETEFGGRTVDCIRVRRNASQKAKEAWQPPPDTEPVDDDLGEDAAPF